MSKDMIKELGIQYHMSINEKIRCKSEDIERRVKYHIANSLAEFIIDNIDELPIDKSEEIEELTGSTVHKVRCLFIDKNELKRLKDIEYKYLGFNKK